MSLLKTIKAQLGLSVTAANNFTLTAEADNGTMKLARGNAGATTQDLITVAADSNVQLNKTNSQSMVRLNTPNGHGSTSTKIRRFTNTTLTQGADITYADSATLGASLTINTNGVYSISYTDSGAAQIYAGLSLNTSAPTTNVYSLAAAEFLGVAYCPAGGANTVTWVGYLAAGSVIRPHTDGGGGAASLNVQLTITRVA